ncbi:MAG: YicC family protein [Candidatus Latescibacteria bacterium]|nr:YicC family protein [bacterium]MBD3422822.1 YicC family protein [Candidatus Latescibacterota bacterium]
MEDLMVRSMTGYGKGEASFKNGSIIVEVRTVNHRFINFSTRLPQEIKALQHDVEKEIRKYIRRGSVNTVVSFDSEYRARHIGLNRAYLKKLYDELVEFSRQNNIPGTVNMSSLLEVPEAIIETDAELEIDEISGALNQALKEALEQCVQMRVREGEELRDDILKRMENVKSFVSEIEKKAPGAAENYFEEAKKRVEELLRNTEVDETRWLNEVAVMAEKLDFSEELTRMNSHIRQFEKEIGENEEAAKKLKFILQEIHREANTLGSKASDIAVINQCLNIKESIEKIREQAANLE